MYHEIMLIANLLPVSRGFIHLTVHNPQQNQSTKLTPPCLHQQRKEGSQHLLLLRIRILCLQ